MTDTFATLIVQAQDVPTSRAIAAAFGPGGANMFTTPLSASGLEPVTHYISSGYIPAEFVAMSPMATWALDEDGDWVQTDYYAGDAAGGPGVEWIDPAVITSPERIWAGGMNYYIKEVS